MTLTIKLSKRDEERLTAAARTKGLDASTFAHDLLVDHLPPTTSGDSQTSSMPRVDSKVGRQPGSAKGIITLTDDLDTPLDDFGEYM